MSVRNDTVKLYKTVTREVRSLLPNTHPQHNSTRKCCEYGATAGTDWTAETDTNLIQEQHREALLLKMHVVFFYGASRCVFVNRS